MGPLSIFVSFILMTSVDAKAFKELKIDENCLLDICCSSPFTLEVFDIHNLLAHNFNQIKDNYCKCNLRIGNQNEMCFEIFEHIWNDFDKICHNRNHFKPATTVNHTCTNIIDISSHIRDFNSDNQSGKVCFQGMSIELEEESTINKKTNICVNVTDLNDLSTDDIYNHWETLFKDVSIMSSKRVQRDEKDLLLNHYTKFTNAESPFTIHDHAAKRYLHSGPMTSRNSSRNIIIPMMKLMKSLNSSLLKVNNNLHNILIKINSSFIYNTLEGKQKVSYNTDDDYDNDKPNTLFVSSKDQRLSKSKTKSRFTDNLEVFLPTVSHKSSHINTKFNPLASHIQKSPQHYYKNQEGDSINEDTLELNSDSLSDLRNPFHHSSYLEKIQAENWYEDGTSKNVIVRETINHPLGSDPEEYNEYGEKIVMPHELAALKNKQIRFQIRVRRKSEQTLPQQEMASDFARATPKYASPSTLISTETPDLDEKGCDSVRQGLPGLSQTMPKMPHPVSSSNNKVFGIAPYLTINTTVNNNRFSSNTNKLPEKCKTNLLNYLKLLNLPTQTLPTTHTSVTQSSSFNGNGTVHEKIVPPLVLQKREIHQTGKAKGTSENSKLYEEYLNSALASRKLKREERKHDFKARKDEHLLPISIDKEKDYKNFSPKSKNGVEESTLNLRLRKDCSNSGTYYLNDCNESVMVCSDTDLTLDTSYWEESFSTGYECLLQIKYPESQKGSMHLEIKPYGEGYKDASCSQYWIDYFPYGFHSSSNDVLRICGTHLPFSTDVLLNASSVPWPTLRFHSSNQQLMSGRNDDGVMLRKRNSFKIKVKGRLGDADAREHNINSIPNQPGHDQPPQYQPEPYKPPQDQPQQDQPGPDNSRQDQPGPDQPGQDQPGPDQPGPDQPEPDQPGPDQPRQDQPGLDKPEQNQPRQDPPRQDQPEQDQPRPDQPRREQPGPDQPRQDQPQPDKPRPDKPEQDQPGEQENQNLNKTPDLVKTQNLVKNSNQNKRQFQNQTKNRKNKNYINNPKKITTTELISTNQVDVDYSHNHQEYLGNSDKIFTLDLLKEKNNYKEFLISPSAINVICTISIVFLALYCLLSLASRFYVLKHNYFSQNTKENILKY